MKIMKIISFVFITTIAIQLVAKEEWVDGKLWHYTVLGSEVSVGGDEHKSELAVSQSTSGKITIPAFLGGYPVTKIGTGAFKECKLLTEVVIPNNITIIGSHAFSGCKSLIKVVIPDSVTSIRQGAFSGCDALEKVTIGKNVVNIEQYAFMNSSNLDRLEIAWLRTIANLSAMGVGDGNGELIVKDIAKYSLSSELQDRAIANIEIEGDTAIDSFVLKDGKVFDCAVRIVNKSEKGAKVSLPKGFVYEKFRGTKPLHIPAASTNLLTITRTKGNTFLISREELVLEVQE
jgi:hypothetical protein